MSARTAASDEFFASVAAARQSDIARVADVIRKHLPKGYEEAFSSKMLVWQVPFAMYPDTYNGHPLWYAALASHKSYMSLYLMPAYGDAALLARLKDGTAAAGKKLDMGKACIHFKTADDLALDVVGDIVASVPMDRWIAVAKAARKR